jgi:hypothetical protein
VVVAGSESGQVSETVEGDGVLGRRESNGTGVSRDSARVDIVGRLGTDKETVTAENGVGGEAGSLSSQRLSPTRRENLP